MLVNTSIQSINAPLQAVPLLLVSRIRGNDGKKLSSGTSP